MWFGNRGKVFIYFGCETTFNSNPGEKKKKKVQTQAGQEGKKKKKPEHKLSDNKENIKW